MTRPLQGPAPRLRAPEGSVDTHMHIFTAAHPSRPGGPPAPEPATVADYRVVQARLGTRRAVVVQPNAY